MYDTMTKMMTFDTALRMLRSGAFVRRKHWDSGFLSLHTDGPEPVIVVHLKSGRTVTWFMDQRDLLSDDWVEHTELNWKGNLNA